MNPTVTDADVFKVLDKISDYEQLLIELCAVIQDGHILLSRAQYDSGYSSMNSTYLPEPGVHEITPTSFLGLTENERFSLVTTKPDPKSGIRKRKKVGKECEKEKTEESSKEPEEEKEPSPVKLSDDPLNWFGLMAPTSLVQAQTRFKSAIERIVEISNLKQELTESLTEFESLSDNFQKKCSVETNED